MAVSISVLCVVCVAFLCGILLGVSLRGINTLPTHMDNSPDAHEHVHTTAMHTQFESMSLQSPPHILSCPPPPNNTTAPVAVVNEPVADAPVTTATCAESTCSYTEPWARDNLELFALLLSAEAEFIGRIDWNGMGHVGRYPIQHFAYFEYARLPHVTQVCEIGFNAGHSSIAFLSAKKQNKLLTFDQGDLRWSKHQHALFKRAFPTRFQVQVGKSQHTVPRYTTKNPGWHGCDLVSIDGDHSDPGTVTDLKNMIKLSKVGTLILFDDYDWHGVTIAREWGKSNGFLVNESCHDNNHFVGEYKKAWCVYELAKVK